MSSQDDHSAQEPSPYIVKRHNGFNIQRHHDGSYSWKLESSRRFRSVAEAQEAIDAMLKAAKGLTDAAEAGHFLGRAGSPGAMAN